MLTVSWWTHVWFILSFLFQLCRKRNLWSDSIPHFSANQYPWAVHQDNISGNVHWFICLPIKTKVSKVYHIRSWGGSTPVPSGTDVPHSTQIQAERMTWTHSIFNLKPINKGKNGIKYDSNKRTGIFKGNKIYSAGMTGEEMFHCFRYKSKGFESSPYKYLLTPHPLAWGGRRHFTLHFAHCSGRLFLPASLSWSLTPISIFWSTHFFQWLSFGECQLVCWLFHKVSVRIILVYVMSPLIS